MKFLKIPKSPSRAMMNRTKEEIREERITLFGLWLFVMIVCSIITVLLGNEYRM